MERVNFLHEELSEFTRGVIFQDLEEQADALVDLVYVALGTAALLGLPWQQLWDDVHRANMTKELGTTKRNMTNDVTKPPGWVGPHTGQILRAYGYDRSKFTDGTEEVEDHLCLEEPGYAKDV